MIIKKIEIENFRSYYKSNVFELVNGLNLIIGSNGDGKTTFYEALEWLFRTDGTSKADTKLISKKRSEELFALPLRTSELHQQAPRRNARRKLHYKSLQERR